MADKFRTLIKVIGNEISKHRLLNSATVAFGNATEKTQEKLNSIQSTVASKYDVISKQLNSETTIFQDLNAARLQPAPPLPQRIIKWWQWYQHLTGLDLVELSKQQVILAQDKLFKCQDARRNLNQEAIFLNDKLKEIYAELVQTKRDDPKYVQLTIMENKSLQEQAKLISKLNLLEKEEKDCFTLLATAIKEYHDSQAMNAQKYKYLSILASALFAIVSLTGSMIYNNQRIMAVRHVIADAQQKNEEALHSDLHSLENNFDAKFLQVLQKLESIKFAAETESTVVKQNSENLVAHAESALSNNTSVSPTTLYICTMIGGTVFGIFLRSLLKDV